jgi:hypothetical protein
MLLTPKFAAFVACFSNKGTVSQTLASPFMTSAVPSPRVSTASMAQVC